MASDFTPGFLDGLLSHQEQLVLATLKDHEGFKVLQKLFEAKCLQANEAVIRLDPAADRFDQQVKALQGKARAINEFAADVLKAFGYYEATAKARLFAQEARGEETTATGPLAKLQVVKSN